MASGLAVEASGLNISVLAGAGKDFWTAPLTAGKVAQRVFFHRVFTSSRSSRPSPACISTNTTVPHGASRLGQLFTNSRHQFSESFSSPRVGKYQGGKWPLQRIRKFGRGPDCNRRILADPHRHFRSAPGPIHPQTVSPARSHLRAGWFRGWAASEKGLFLHSHHLFRCGFLQAKIRRKPSPKNQKINN